MEPEERDFFAAVPAVLPIYARIKDHISALAPQTRVEVRKSQISFIDARVFSAAWLPPRKIKGRPEHYLVLTLWLTHPLEGARIAEATQIRPGRWANHVIISEIDEVDEELSGWLAEALNFSRQ